MKIKDLIAMLSAYPMDAEVHLIGLEEPWLADRTTFFASTPLEAQRWAEENAGNMIFVNAVPAPADLDAFEDADTLQEQVRETIATCLNLLVAEVAAFVVMKMLESGYDEVTTSEQVQENYWARMEDEYDNLPIGVTASVRKYADSWGVFLKLVFERAERAAKSVQGL